MENWWFKPENVKSIPEMLLEAVEKYEEKPALIYMGKKISYRELYHLSRKVSKFIDEKSSHRSRIAIMMPNIPQFVMCYFGALTAGRIAVPVNFISIVKELKSKKCTDIKITSEIKTQICDSRPEIIFVVDFMYPILMQVEIDWPCIIVVASPADFLPFPLNY